MAATNKEKVADEMKKCRALQASWNARAEKYYGDEGMRTKYCTAVNRGAIYGTVADHLEQILDEWDDNKNQ